MLEARESKGVTIGTISELEDQLHCFKAADRFLYFEHHVQLPVSMQTIISSKCRLSLQIMEQRKRGDEWQTLGFLQHALVSDGSLREGIVDEFLFRGGDSQAKSQLKACLYVYQSISSEFYRQREVDRSFRLRLRAVSNYQPKHALRCEIALMRRDQVFVSDSQKCIEYKHEGEAAEPEGKSKSVAFGENYNEIIGIDPDELRWQNRNHLHEFYILLSFYKAAKATSSKGSGS